MNCSLSTKLKYLNDKYRDAFDKLGHDISNDLVDLFDLSDPAQLFLARLIGEQALKSGTSISDVVIGLQVHEGRASGVLIS
jgi:hypothetical protein